MSISLKCDSVNVLGSGNYTNKVTAELEGIDAADVVSQIGEAELLEAINIKEIVSNVGTDVLLDEIGADECKRYFDLKDRNEE